MQISPNCIKYERRIYGGRGSASGIARKTNFPNLVGSEKQVKWAQDIREEAINTVDDNIKLARERYEKYKMEIYKDAEEAYKEVKKQLIPALATYTKASDLIDRRDMFSSSRIIDLAQKIEEQLRKKRNK